MSCHVVSSLCCSQRCNLKVLLPDRRVQSSCAGSDSGRCDGRTAPRSHTSRSPCIQARSDRLCSRCHIWVQSSPRGRGTFLSQDRMQLRLRSRTPQRSPDRSYLAHTLCDSGLHETLEDRCIGPTRGDRRHCSCSRIAAGTAGHRDQEGRRVHTDIRSSLVHTDTSPSLCHKSRCFDSYISADSWHQIGPRDTLCYSELQSSPDHRCSCLSENHTLLHYCSYSVGCNLPQTSLEGNLVHSPLLCVQGCTRTDQ